MPTMNWIGKQGETLDRHDRWLSMMYPRPVLLRQFLREDGAIFISIDDNEVATPRLLMDESFAQLAEFVWCSETGTGYSGKADSPLLGDHNGRAIHPLYNGILKTSPLRAAMC